MSANRRARRAESLLARRAASAEPFGERFGSKKTQSPFSVLRHVVSPKRRPQPTSAASVAHSSQTSPTPANRNRRGVPEQESFSADFDPKQALHALLCSAKKAGFQARWISERSRFRDRSSLVRAEAGGRVAQETDALSPEGRSHICRPTGDIVSANRSW